MSERFDVTIDVVSGLLAKIVARNPTALDHHKAEGEVVEAQNQFC